MSTSVGKEREERLQKSFIDPGTPLEQATQRYNEDGVGILLVCSENRCLLGVVTGGNIRRALLTGVPKNSPVLSIAEKNPLLGSVGVRQEQVLQLMNYGKKFPINQLPVVDQNGIVVDLWFRSDVEELDVLDVHAVIMAGGYGKRLHPLTENTPKPMLPVGEEPLLERIIVQLRDSGIKTISIATHFMPDKIKEHIADGSKYGVEVDYLQEEEPLGTAGALSMLSSVNGQSLLVINGDILTDMSFRSMYDFHREHSADATLALAKYEFRIPYGVAQCEDVVVTALKEKPQYDFFVNAGIYMIESSMREYVPKYQQYSMVDLIQFLIGKGKAVVGYPVVEYWLDIGSHEDYLKAKNIGNG